MLPARPSPVPFRSVPFLAALLLAACGQTGAPDAASSAVPTAPPGPAKTLERLTDHLRRNDFEGFAREAVPPPLHDRLDAAWRAGRTRWPLDELPFGAHLPGMLQTLAAPGSETHLQKVFDQQFSGADRQLHGAAVSLGLFGTQYLETARGYGDAERQHYTQLIQAAAGWSTHAPLGDRARARQGLSTLAAAARRTGLSSPDAFQRLGMDEGLRRVGPFAAAFKRAVAGYGLDLDADLGTLRATLVQQTGDSARVRMRYRFAGTQIDTELPMQRLDGRWYLVEFLRHAEAAASAGAPAANAVPPRIAEVRPRDAAK